MGARYVIVTGADLVTDLNDERRFCKYVGRDLEALRLIGGDGLFTAYNDEPNWHKAHNAADAGLHAGVHAPLSPGDARRRRAS